MTVARGMAMGGEGSAGPAGCVANGHITVGRWGKGGRGSGRLAGGGGGGGKGGRGGGGGGGGGGGRGASSPPSIKPVGWPWALKKIEIQPVPAH